MNIFVGNLTDKVNEDDLRGVFEAFGQVESVNILKDRFSGESRGFGFLEMPSKDEAQLAIKEADGKDLKGTAIRVNEAHPRPSDGPHRRGGARRSSSSRGSSPRGGRGGGRGGTRSY